jgi:hypothetical protein
MGQAIVLSCQRCMADYDAGPELVDQLKLGQMLLLEAVDAANSPISLRVPLVDFAPTMDPHLPPKRSRGNRSQLAKEIHELHEPQKRAEDDRKTRCESK